MVVRGPQRGAERMVPKRNSIKPQIDPSRKRRLGLRLPPSERTTGAPAVTVSFREAKELPMHQHLSPDKWVWLKTKELELRGG